MDSEPLLLSKSNDFDSLAIKKEGDQFISDEEDPYSLSGPSISLIGFAISLLMVAIPFFAVLTERQSAQKSYVPTALDRNGSNSPSSFSFSWISKSRS